MTRDWKSDLAKCFEEFRIIESCQKETVKEFNQFCEFIAEPCFESLAEELKPYGASTRIKKNKDKSIIFQVSFPPLKIKDFQYIIFLPKNSFKLKLKLKIRGGTTKRGRVQEKEEMLMKKWQDQNMLGLDKTALIQDVIEYFRSFVFETLVHEKT